jgi:sulfate adenylyltransferase subunit 1 (EFTu-like GTPase family)
MVAGFVKLHLKQNQVDEAIRYWNTTVSDAKTSDKYLREKLHGSFLLIDRKTGHGYSIGLWSSANIRL